MRFAFVLFRYFPHGGLQRDCAAIARLLVEQGHGVEIITGGWAGPPIEGTSRRVLAVRALTNHGRNEAFARAARARWIAAGHDVVVGFDRMPGLDIHYAADCCFLAKTPPRRRWLARLRPRWRHFTRFERAVYGAHASTHALLLTESEKAVLRQHYGTPEERLHVLPPAIATDRRRGADAAASRARLRAELAVGPDERLILLIGSSFRTKGVDRAIRAVAALPGGPPPRLVLVGLPASAERRARALARALDLRPEPILLGPRNDVPALLQAADLLIHPARRENTGTVILEAVAAGLPVLCTASCGFAPHVAAADCGRVVGEPFRQEALNAALAGMLDADRLAGWSRRALAYAEATDLHGGHRAAARLIVELGARRIRPG